MVPTVPPKPDQDSPRPHTSSIDARSKFQQSIQQPEPEPSVTKSTATQRRGTSSLVDMAGMPHIKMGLWGQKSAPRGSNSLGLPVIQARRPDQLQGYCIHTLRGSLSKAARKPFSKHATAVRLKLPVFLFRVTCVDRKNIDKSPEYQFPLLHREPLESSPKVA